MRGIFRAGRYAIAYVPQSRHSGSTLRPLHGVCLRTRRARASGAVFAPVGRSPRRSGPSRPSGRCRLRRPRPLRLEGPPLYACRYALCGYGCIERDRLCDGRSAKPRGAAPECRVELRPTRHRATSHNGARYAFVRSKTPSHVALSGAPPRPSPLKKSGSRARHIF